MLSFLVSGMLIEVTNQGCLQGILQEMFHDQHPSKECFVSNDQCMTSNSGLQGKIHLGDRVFIDRLQWNLINMQQNDSRFVKQMGVAIWGEEALKDRSVTGAACNAKKNTPEYELAKPPLSPHKVEVIRDCLKDRLKREGASSDEIHLRVKKVNKYLCEKIMDLNRKARRSYHQPS